MIPLQLLGVLQGERTYDDILVQLRNHAEQKGVAVWLERQIEGVTRGYVGESNISESKLLIHHLLFQALVDLRSEASATQNDKVFCLAHLFHNTPLDLVSVLEGKRSYDELCDKLLGWVRDRTPLWGCEVWLKQAVQDIMSSFPAHSEA